MVIRLNFTYFSLINIIVFYLFLLSTTLKHVKTEKHHAQNKPTITKTQPSLTFFMHDIIGGLNPSERIVNGIINTQQTTKLPFAKPNNKIFPDKGSIPIFENDSPSSTSTMIKNIDKNKVVIIDSNSNSKSKSKSIPFVMPNQFPRGETLLFGRITVIDDEITKGYELNSEVIGKAQGFHLVSSLDGSSQTMAFTALFGEGQENDDAISFFGVHRMATHESYIAVVGGIGKYENVRGFARIETLHLPYQHESTSNGMETLFQITVYL